MSIHRLLSICTIGAVGLASKVFLKGFCKSISVSGLHHLLDALKDSDGERSKGRGIVTVANHVSTLDDPLIWGVLPSRCYFNLRDMRWALGASDIMFTNPAFSAFFRKGQVIETFRGNGVYQPAVDTAIKKLNEGGWVHLFGEGKVNQPWQYEVSRNTKEDREHRQQGLLARLPRFRWGTGRILMETKRLPIIIPMWLSGFENVMPEPRPPGFPAKFLPRLHQSVRITFAPPLDDTRLREILSTRRKPDGSAKEGDTEENNTSSLPDTAEIRRVREALTAVLQQAVERLGYATSGPFLGRPAETAPKGFTPR